EATALDDRAAASIAGSAPRFDPMELQLVEGVGQHGAKGRAHDPAALIVLADPGVEARAAIVPVDGAEPYDAHELFPRPDARDDGACANECVERGENASAGVLDRVARMRRREPGAQMVAVLDRELVEDFDVTRFEDAELRS